MQRFLEGAANRHGFAHRLHRGGERLFSAREFFKGEARNFGDDIINGRLERGRRCAACNIVVDLVERVADRELGRDTRNREAGCFGRQSRGARHARVHLDHDHAAGCRINRELHVRATRFNANLAQYGQRGVAHDLVFFIGERQCRGHRDGITCVHAHRVNVFNRADDDAVVRFIANHFHLVFFPAQHAFLDQHFIGWGSINAALDDFDEFRLIISNAAAGATHGERGADNGGQADVGECFKRLRQCLDMVRARRIQPDLGHRVAEQLAVFGLVDGFGGRADHLDIVFFQDAHFLERERAVQRRLAAHGREQRIGALFLDDLCDDFRRDRLDIGAVRHVGVGHDGGGVRVDEDDAVALLLQRFHGLCAGIIELAGLADHNRACANDQDRGYIGALWHGARSLNLQLPPCVDHIIAHIKKGRASWPIKRPERVLAGQILDVALRRFDEPHSASICGSPESPNREGKSLHFQGKIVSYPPKVEAQFWARLPLSQPVRVLTA